MQTIEGIDGWVFRERERSFIKFEQLIKNLIRHYST